MTSRQRKNIKKERKKINDQGVTVSRICGSEITLEMLETFYQFYQVTYLKRGMRGYLNFEFFKKIVDSIPETIMLVLAKNNSGEYVAGALNFFDDEKLYGRYWGCLEEYDSLHFETCYYQGIEFCIEEKLKSFDPGVQGEHKIKRGFKPTETFSAHWIADGVFYASAGASTLEAEKLLPLFRRSDRPGPAPLGPGASGGGKHLAYGLLLSCM